MRKFLAVAIAALALAPGPAMAAGPSFYTDGAGGSITHASINGYVLETSPDGVNAAPAGTSASPLYVTGGVGGSGGAYVGAVTDRSFTSTPGTAQTIFPVNASRHWLAFQIPQSTSGCWVSFTGTAAANAAGSYFRGAGYDYESGTFVPSGAVSFLCSGNVSIIPASEG